MSDLTAVPPLLERWLSNYAETCPKPTDVAQGDLWVLSWDNAYLGLVCVSAVKDDYILGWPVTLPDEPGFSPALVLKANPLGMALYLWPSRETGLGMHLLHAPLGHLIEPRRIQPIAWAFEDGEDPGIPFANGSASQAVNEAADAAMTANWERLCFHTWPDSNRSYLSETAIKKFGGTAARAAACLQMLPMQLRPLWTGVQPASDEQVAKLAEDLRVSAQELLGKDPLMPVLNRLAHPRFKRPLLQLTSQEGVTEGLSRDRTREEYALAARDDSTIINDARLLDAIKRVAANGQSSD